MTLSVNAKKSFLDTISPHIVYSPENALANIRQVRRIALTADASLQIYNVYEAPSADISEALLSFVANKNDAMGWLATRITLNGTGCWTLPLKSEYDTKRRARYPQVSSAKFNAHSELAHRFVIRRIFGANLTRSDQWDHICRNHNCCNITHGEVASAAVNNQRRIIAQNFSIGPTLF